MARPKFSPTELEPSGKIYPKMPPMMNIEFPDEPVLNRPITAKENMKLALSGQKPYWLPYVGWFLCDLNQFRPRVCPDNIANHQVFDGGPAYDYSTLGSVAHSSWFDLDWVWENNIGGATMYPGNPKVKDINEWEKYISMPNLDDYDWSLIASENEGYLGSDKMNVLGIQCGLWERLMALTDVVEASLAMYEEETKPAVHRFFDAYSNFIIDYIDRVSSRCPIGSVVLHEDWAHQKGPFFSMEVAREMLLPYIKRIIDFVHSKGMFFEWHMCGDCKKIVPVMIEAGGDMWCGQSDLNDLIGLAKEYKQFKFLFGVPYPEVDPEADEATVENAAKAFVDDIKGLHVGLFNFNAPLPPSFPSKVYEYARKAYENA